MSIVWASALINLVHVPGVEFWDPCWSWGFGVGKGSAAHGLLWTQNPSVRVVENTHTPTTTNESVGGIVCVNQVSVEAEDTSVQKVELTVVVLDGKVHLLSSCENPSDEMNVKSALLVAEVRAVSTCALCCEVFEWSGVVSPVFVPSTSKLAEVEVSHCIHRWAWAKTEVSLNKRSN